MIKVSIATEEDISRLLEIEMEMFSPPWSHGALLSEIYRDDSFFAVAVTDNAQHKIHSSHPQNRREVISQEFSAHDSGSFIKDESTDYYGVSPSAKAKEAVREDAVIVGFIILRRAADEGELFQIAVDKAARRRGIADMLMSAALEYAGDNALKSLYLEVRKSNDAAIALYKKHGFKTVRHRKDYYISPIEDAVIMRREGSQW